MKRRSADSLNNSKKRSRLLYHAMIPILSLIYPMCAINDFLSICMLTKRFAVDAALVVYHNYAFQFRRAIPRRMRQKIQHIRCLDPKQTDWYDFTQLKSLNLVYHVTQVSNWPSQLTELRVRGIQSDITLPSGLQKYVNRGPAPTLGLTLCAVHTLIVKVLPQVEWWPSTLTDLQFQEYQHPFQSPDTLTTLIIGNAFHDTIILSPGLRTLSIGSGFQHPISFPDSLTHLGFSPQTDIDYNWPAGLQRLCLRGNSLNKPLPIGLKELLFLGPLQVNTKWEHLPSGLEELGCFQHASECEMDFLSRLTNLKSLYGFNACRDTHLQDALSNVKILRLSGIHTKVSWLPANLISLHLANFVAELPCLPPTLTRLVFPPGAPYNHPLPPLPDSLLVLKLNDDFNHELILPSRLKRLVIGRNFEQTLPTLPDTLTSLKMLAGPASHEVYVLPKNLLKLEVRHRVKRVLSYQRCTCLKEVSLGGHFQDTKFRLPDTVTFLNIEPLNLKKVQLHIPPNLKVLFMPEGYTKLPHFPDTLTVLHFGDKFSLPILTLPNGLRHLSFGRKWNHPVDFLLNLSCLTTLAFGNPDFNHAVFIPTTVEKLIISKEYPCPLPTTCIVTKF